MWITIWLLWITLCFLWITFKKLWITFYVYTYRTFAIVSIAICYSIIYYYIWFSILYQYVIYDYISITHNWYTVLFEYKTICTFLQSANWKPYDFSSVYRGYVYILSSFNFSQNPGIYSIFTPLLKFTSSNTLLFTSLTPQKSIVKIHNLT